jgi:hypothetical protein
MSRAPGVTHLVGVMREKAAELRSLEAAGQAAGIEWAARLLEGALREAADATLTLEQAAAESGYSGEYLRKLIATGELSQAGRKGAPRVRRADLPRKATRNPGVYDAAADALSLVQRMATRRGARGAAE